jgi:hypothetical protein
MERIAVKEKTAFAVTGSCRYKRASSPEDGR